MRTLITGVHSFFPFNWCVRNYPKTSWQTSELLFLVTVWIGIWGRTFPGDYSVEPAGKFIQLHSAGSWVRLEDPRGFHSLVGWICIPPHGHLLSLYHFLQSFLLLSLSFPSRIAWICLQHGGWFYKIGEMKADSLL